MEIYDRDIALEQYKYGLEKKDDLFVKFMMHWVAFNWLYSKYEDNDKMAKGESTEEWRKIEIFCKEH